MRWMFVAMAALTGCSTPLLFTGAPVVWRASDDRDIAEPDPYEDVNILRHGDTMVMDRIDRALAVPDEEPARDVNALDEVPDSTWFENRIGRFDLTPDDVARGPGGAPPEPPLRIKSGKNAGSNPGFFAEDASGRKFLIKLDPPGAAEMVTGNAPVVARILWSAGYHVPREHVVTFRDADVTIAPKAMYETPTGRERLFGYRMLDAVLAKAARTPDGRVRALASELLPGKPMGGWAPSGVREDDPNDVIPHEHRRVLRGLRVFCAWLDHSDIHRRNTLDMYVNEGGRRFLKHHLVDFGEALGAHSMNHPWMSYSYSIDPEYLALSTLAFGLWKRPWEDDGPRPLPSVGLYFPDFDPTLWREAKPYGPFSEMTAADAFWAAKIVMRFRREHLAAAVGQGRFTDPRTERYLVDTLLERRRRIGLAYMNETTALDWFEVSRDRLCMTDLSVHYRLAPFRRIERVVRGDVAESIEAWGKGRACLSGPGDDAYMVYELRTADDDDTHAKIEVHVRGGREAPRVLGVVRDF